MDLFKRSLFMKFKIFYNSYLGTRAVKCASLIFSYLILCNKLEVNLEDVSPKTMHRATGDQTRNCVT